MAVNTPNRRDVSQNTASMPASLSTTALSSKRKKRVKPPTSRHPPSASRSSLPVKRHVELLEDYEYRMAQAVAAVNAVLGKNKDYRAIAQLFNVNKSTLYNRATGKATRRDLAHASQQFLTSAEEDVLVKWATWLSRAAIPWTYEVLRLHTLEITGRKPSHKWIYAFLHRHPTLRPSKSVGLESKRAG
jgi:transposase